MHIILFKGFQRWGFLVFIWSAAITGIVLKTLFFAQTPMWLGLSLYLGLGWTGLISGAFLWKRYGYRFMAPLFYGGIAYSLGVVFEVVTAAMLDSSRSPESWVGTRFSISRCCWGWRSTGDLLAVLPGGGSVEQLRLTRMV